jgi:ribosomal protein L30
MAKDTKKILITQVKSPIGSPATRRRRSALGLKRINHTVEQDDTPSSAAWSSRSSTCVRVEEL